MRVEIWSDVVCPWCYIGDAHFRSALETFEHRDDVEVVYRSFQLDPSHPEGSVEPVVDMLTKKFGPQAAAAQQRVAGVAASAGLPYRTDRLAGNTFHIHRVLQLAKARGVQEEVYATVFDHYFGAAANVFDEDVLVSLVVAVGLDEDEVRAVLADPTAYADDVRGDVREGAQLGARGVPFFVLDRRLGVSGGQPSEVFAQALAQAWDSRPVEQLAAVEGDVCEPDGSCAVPGTDA